MTSERALFRLAIGISLALWALGARPASGQGADPLAAVRDAIGPGATIVADIAKVATDQGQIVVVALYHEKSDGLRVGRFEKIKGRWRPVWQSEDLAELMQDNRPDPSDVDADGSPEIVYEGCRKGACCSAFARVVMPKKGPGAWILRFDHTAKPRPEAAMEVAPGSPRSRKVFDYLLGKARKKACGAEAEAALKRVPF